MRLTPEAVDWLVSFGSVVVAVAAAAGGAWKFWVWLQDRDLQAQIESAAHFKKEGLEPWQVEFGRKRLERLHFRRLTGVDVTSGHRSIVNLHEKMGGEDHDWELLAKIRRFLSTDGRVARVLPMRRRQAWNSVIVSVVGLALFGVACALMTVSLHWSMRSHWTAMSLGDFSAILVAGIYSGVFGFAGWVCIVLVGRAVRAQLLRRRLVRPRFERMRKQRAAARASAAA